MSRHFSKFALNTWSSTPYFQVHVPASYPLSLVLQSSRAFRRLPLNLRRLSVLSKEWADSHDFSGEGIEQWYDDQGYELDPDTGRRLTDAEIDAEWDDLGILVGGVTVDVPVPDGGFPDPETWEPPPTVDAGLQVSQDQLLADIASRGRTYVARDYGIPLEQLPGYTPDTVEEQEGEDWQLATERFKRRASRVMGSVWMRDHPKDKATVAAALKHADLKWDLVGVAEALFDLAEDHT